MDDKLPVKIVPRKFVRIQYIHLIYGINNYST